MTSNKNKISEKQIQEFLEIFKKIYEKFGMNQSEIARTIQISPSSISNYLSRNYNPPAKVILKMKKLLDDLVLENKKSKTDPDPDSDPKNIKEIPLFHERDFPKGKKLPDLSESDRFKLILGFRTKDQDSFFIAATTDSMVGSGIQKGDYLLVEPNRNIKPGDLVLCNHPRFGLLAGKYCHPSENLVIIFSQRGDCGIILLLDNEVHEVPVYRISYIEREL